MGPQIEIKYKQGGKEFIHRASHLWTKFSGEASRQLKLTDHESMKVLVGTSTRCFPTHKLLETYYLGVLRQATQHYLV